MDDTGGPQELARLLQEQRFHRLRHAVDEALADDELDDERARALRDLRGELAWRGHGPVSDAVLAAREALDLPDGEEMPPMVAHAVRAAGRAGARDTARALLDHALERWPESEGLRFVEEQTDQERWRGRTRPLWQAEQLLAEGRLEEAAGALEQLTGEPTEPDTADEARQEERLRALLRLAELRRAEARFDDAAALHDAAVLLYPEAEDAPLLRLAAALELWAAGDAGAAEGLRQIRHDTKEGRRAEERYARQVAGDLLASLERLDQQEPAPRWTTLAAATRFTANAGSCPGRAALELVHRAMDLEVDGQDDGAAPLPTMAHLRHALARTELTTARVRIYRGEVDGGPPALERLLVEMALRQGALLLLEEERPTETGFLLLTGFEPQAGVLMLTDPRRTGPLLRSQEDQGERSALHGGGALLVAPPGEAGRRTLEVIGAADDEHLLLVDRCNLDEQGRVPAQARIAAQAAEGIAAAPDLPMLHRRHGESLLEQVRMGNIEFGPVGPFERWLATARHGFPGAEWPFQIYARALEMQERYEEAGIAWSDAMLLDPHDERNLLGQARVLAQQGRLGNADDMLRRALTLRQDQSEVWARRAEIALSLERLDEAALYATMATEMDPSDLGALMSLASVQERSERPADAIEVLWRVAEEDADHVPARNRLLHHRVHRGEWVEANRLAAEICALIPGYAHAWETSAWVAWGAGQGERAMELCMAGLQRCGPEGGLLEMAVQVLATALPTEQAGGALKQLVEQLAASPPALLDVATGLGKRRWHAEAMHLAELTRQMLPMDPNPTWRLCQIILGDPALRVSEDNSLDALLQETVDGAGPFPFPRVILAWRLLDSEPERSLELVAGANEAHAPGPVWSLQALALDRLERGEEAEQIRARLPETFPGGVLESMALLAELGLHEVCGDLLARLQEALPTCHEASVELARLRGLTGDLQGRLDLLLATEAEDEDVVPLPMLLDAAAEVGAWEAVQRTAEQILPRVERNSRSSYDAWPVRGRVAGAALALGDEEPRQRLLRLAPRHPGALRALCEAERLAEHPLLAEDWQRLLDVAPGVARTLEDRT